MLSLAAAAALVAAACSSNDDDGTDPDATSTQASLGGEATTTTPAGPGAPAAGSFATEEVATGFSRPVFVTNAGDGSGRLFVVEKPGTIEIVKDGKRAATPFLDITAIVRSSSNEQGLLGLAFHPEFARNGRFFVAYTGRSGENSVAEYRVSPPSGDVADTDSAKLLIAVSDPFPNHNGGMLAFGPDGYLYISMGDGGSAGDPNGNGQDLGTMLGKILRIDIDGGGDYAIPATNPFANQAGAKPEIWAYGLRNPWRFSFDRETGDLWIADVGQNKYEEIDFQSGNSKGGENYGWNTMEGDHCFKPAQGCDQSGLVKPVFEYDHGKGCSVTGGYVYRGKAVPALSGRYLFTDYCGATLWASTRGAYGKVATAEIGKLPEGVTAFGEDEAGELYFTVDGEGAVYRFVAR